MWSVYKLSLERLLKNWYIVFFVVLTLFPILTVLFLRLNPELLTTPNPNYPSQTIQQSDTPKTSDQIALEQEEEKKNEKIFGPKYFQRSWTEVLFGVTYYFLVGSLVVLSIASLGSRMIANEVEYGTLQLLFLRPIGRCSIYLAKYFALVTTGIILFTPSMLIVYGMTYWDNFSLATLFYDTMILILAIMAYSSLFLFFSIFKEGLYISLGYAIFWEIFIGFVTERARTFAISYYVRSLYYTLFFDPGHFPEYDVIATWQAVTTLFAITLVLLTIGIGFFRKQEFNFC